MRQPNQKNHTGVMLVEWSPVWSMLGAVSVYTLATGTTDLVTGEYLDVVYGAHDQGMVFVAIMWAVFLALIFVYSIGWRMIPSRRALNAKSSEGEPTPVRQHFLARFAATARASIRQYLLPEALRPIFGRVTRLQVLILLSLTVYVTIFTFVGYAYKIWVTPVKNLEGVYNTRTSLGPWSDRIGVIAYALMPLSVLLASRESILSLLTGIPYQNFQFLHRWIGYIIYIQSTLHTIGWTVVEAKLYQPQPKVWTNFIKQQYMIWGTVAMVLMTLILVGSLPCSIRLTGYEVFRKAHYVMAIVFLGACYGHWEQLGCFMIASLVVWFLDRAARLVRTFLLHYQYLPGSTNAMGFQSAQAKISLFADEQNGDVVRLDFAHNHAAWSVGQHFYLCFPESSIWQSHPFTPASLPSLSSTKSPQTHTYVFRARGGETRKLAELAHAKQLMSSTSHTTDAESKKIHTVLPTALQPASRSSGRPAQHTTPVILQGPYGTSHAPHSESYDTNILLVAGGTGITFVLPILQHIMTMPSLANSNMSRKLELIWIVRRRADAAWVSSELETLRAASKSINLRIRIFVTRDASVGKAGATEAVTEKAIEVGKSCCGGAPVSPAAQEKKDEINISQTDDNIASSSSSSTGDLKETPSSTPRRFSIEPTPLPLSAVSDRNTESRHPDVGKLVGDFVSSTAQGPTTVYASGPGGMVTDLREAVSLCNDSGKVWKGDERGDVSLVCDDRIEW
jgi:predicted ferric reductase